MRKTITLFFVLILLGVISVVIIEPSTTSPKGNVVAVPVPEAVKSNVYIIKPEEMVLEKDRFALRQEWFENTREVAEKSGEDEAMAIITFLENHSVLCEPAFEGVRFIEGGKGTQWFSFVPITVNDHSMGPIWEKYYLPMGSGGAANFQPNGRAIIIKSHIKVSPLWRGIILLHEGRHAREFITRAYDWTDTETFCNEERDTHDFQNRIMEKLGGIKYTSFVALIEKDIEGKLKKQGYSPGQAVADRSTNYPELDEIFSPAQSELERDYRETSIWIHANFLLLEHTFGSNAPVKKALMLKTLYSTSGILP